VKTLFSVSCRLPRSGAGIVRRHATASTNGAQAQARVTVTPAGPFGRSAMPSFEGPVTFEGRQMAHGLLSPPTSCTTAAVAHAKAPRSEREQAADLEREAA